MLEKLTGVYSSKKSYYVELKKQINETKKRNTQLEILYKLAKSMNVDIDLPEIMDSMVDELSEILPFEHLELVDFTRESSELSSFFWKSRTATEHHRSFQDFKQVIKIPLIAKGSMIGKLLICNHYEVNYTDSDQLFLEQLAAQLSVCIENLNLYDEAIRRKIEWEETFRAVKDPIIFIDLDHNIQRVNESVLNCYRIELDEVMGQKCYSFLHNRDELCNPCPAREVLKKGKPSQQQQEMRNGRIFDMSYYPVYNNKEEIYGIIQYAKDVTKKLEMEAHWRNLSKQVALGEMAARVAHELNNPLTVILGNIQISLMDLCENNENYKPLTDALSYGLRCQKIIHDLLKFSRYDRNVIVPLDLHFLMDETIDATRFQVDYDQVTISKDYYQHLPVITANPDQLKQVFINVLTNAWDALKSTPEKIITIRTGLIDEHVYITIEDNGQGIRPEHLFRVFDPFFTTKEQGTGLGLSISYGIIKAHGGDISLRSEVGVGSTFRITLPLSIDERETPSPIQEQNQESQVS